MRIIILHNYLFTFSRSSSPFVPGAVAATRLSALSVGVIVGEAAVVGAAIVELSAAVAAAAGSRTGETSSTGAGASGAAGATVFFSFFEMNGIRLLQIFGKNPPSRSFFVAVCGDDGLLPLPDEVAAVFGADVVVGDDDAEALAFGDAAFGKESHSSFVASTGAAAVFRLSVVVAAAAAAAVAVAPALLLRAFVVATSAVVDAVKGSLLFSGFSGAAGPAGVAIGTELTVGYCDAGAEPVGDADSDCSCWCRRCAALAMAWEYVGTPPS